MATSTLGNGTLVLAGTTSGTTTVTATAVAGTTTLTLPAATDTLVGKATTDTLTNKTLTSPTITGGALNGTVGATTPSTGAFTTMSATTGAAVGGATAGAGGLAFPATAVAVANANTLDDYEEGTWTSAVTNTVNVTGTGSLERADYTKIGRLVTIVGYITGLSITTVSSGTSVGLQLPFAAISGTTVVMGPCRASGSTEMIGTVLDSTGGDSTSIGLSFPAAQVTGNGSTIFSFSLTYQASA
jgi:hypothetical protein